jgi:hypothetical protein
MQNWPPSEQHIQAALQLLGIDRDTSLPEAAKQYRKLALQWHPDRNPGDKSKIRLCKALNAAWQMVQPLLPKAATPFPEVDPDDPDFERLVGQWLVDAVANSPAPSPSQFSAYVHDVERRVSTVGIVPQSSLKDWRRQRIRKRATRFSLEKMTPGEAASLFQSYPNSFAALMVLESMHPACCLYSAVKFMFATSTALVLRDTLDVMASWYKEALQDPMESIDEALKQIPVIAPHVHFQGATIELAKLRLDISFLKDYIHTELVPRLTERPNPTGHPR